MEQKVDQVVLNKAQLSLEKVERKRLVVMKVLKRSVYFSFPVLVISLFWVFRYHGTRATLFVILGYIIVYVFWTMFNKSATKYEFKKDFLKPVLGELFPCFNYDPLNYVPDKVFDKSSLFLGTYDYYFGDDLFTGTIANRTFQLSDLDVTRHSRNNANWNFSTQIFKGIFLSVNNLDAKNTHLIIEPISQIEASKSKLVKTLQKFQAQRVELLSKTGYKPFDSVFQLLTSNTIEPLTYLSTKRMDLILLLHDTLSQLQQGDQELEQTTGNLKITISLSVINGTLNLGIKNLQLFSAPFNDDLYESWSLCQSSIDIIRLLEGFVISWFEE